MRTASSAKPATPASLDAGKGSAGGGEEEGKRAGFLDVQTVRRALVLRESGVADGEIEGVLGLRGGLLGGLGGRGAVGVGG